MTKMMSKTMTSLAMGTAMALSIGFSSMQAFAAEGTSPDISQVIAKYDTGEFESYISLDGAVDMGDHYEIKAMLCVPLTFDTNPAEGKQEGDLVPIVISEVTGRTAVFEKGSDDYDEDFGDMTCMYEPYEKDGKWRVVGPNDVELAKEVYNGTLKLSKDAIAEVFDYNQLTYTNEGISGYEHISAEEMVERTEDHETWGVTGQPEIPEDRECDEIAIGTDGKIYSTGEKKIMPGYITCPGSYQVTLDENGEIIYLIRNWMP